MKGRVFNWALWLAGLIILQCVLACGKRCTDPMMLPYPEELHAYMWPYKSGSWWVYENTAGLRDSVYLTEYREFSEPTDVRADPCFGLPTKQFALRSLGMDTLGSIYVTYQMGDGGRSASVDISAVRYQSWTLARFGYSSSEGLSVELVQDTVVGTVQYEAALRIDRKSHQPLRLLESVVIVRDVGIIGYITTSDTFNITQYYVP
jgi:hypothetical protein